MSNKEIYDAAHKAGSEAVERQLEAVVPMTVTDGTNSWFVRGGVCGFAWVTVRPANCSFARYLKEEKGCRLAYGGGMQIWISDYSQSMQMKEFYARAFAEKLREFGIRATSDSRMD